MNEQATRDAKILEWQEATKELAAAKETEAALRKQVLAMCFDWDYDDREGTQNVELGNGYKLKAVFKLNRRLDNKDDKVDKILTKIEKSGPEGEFIAERLVKWKPELALSEYKNLPEKFKKLIDEVLTASPGTPGLELVIPKSK